MSHGFWSKTEIHGNGFLLFCLLQHNQAIKCFPICILCDIFAELCWHLSRLEHKCCWLNPWGPYQTGATRHTTVSHVIQGTIWQRCAPAGSMGVAKVSSKLYPGSASPTNLRIRISKLQAQVLKILAFIGYSTLNSDPSHISPGVFVGLPSVAWCPKPSGNLVEELRIPLPEK